MSIKIGIFGGSFNPPHIAHLVVAESIRDQFGLNKILWIPSYLPPHKLNLHLPDAGHRVAMTKLATASNSAFEVSLLEIERQGTSFTIDTVNMLVSQYPSDTFYLVIGGDSLVDFMTWRAPADIISRVELLVYQRPDQDIESAEAYAKFSDRIHIAKAPLLEISSATIRSRMRAGQSIRHLVPDPVYDYIVEHQLYLSSSDF